MKKTFEKLQCEQCHKKYSEERSLAVHLKTKHRNDDKSQKYQSLKLKLCSQTFLKAEEQIFLFLSQLSHKYAYSLENLVTLKLYDPICHSAGKNHFLINPIVKNPFECQDPEEEMTEKINFIARLNQSGKNGFKQILIKEIQRLNSVLDSQNTKWYFADPYDDSIDFNEEFTLDNIPKLVKNCIKRKMQIQSISTCVFILWMGKYLKNQPFIDIWKIVCLVEDCFLKSTNIKQRQGQNGVKSETKFKGKMDESVLDEHYSRLGLTFSSKEFKKWVQLYCNWHEKIWDLIEIFEGKI